MKKLTSILLALVMIFASVATFASCDKKQNEDNGLNFGKELLSVGSQLDALNGLVKGDADIAVIDSVMAGYYMNGVDTFKDYQILPGVVLAEEQYGIAAKKGNAALIGKINEAMIALAGRVVANEMSVRETENAVKRMNNLENEPVEEDKTPVQIKLHMKELERRAMSTLGRKVRISRSSHKKVVELSYDDDSDLEALLLSLCGEKIFKGHEAVVAIAILVLAAISVVMMINGTLNPF